MNQEKQIRSWFIICFYTLFGPLYYSFLFLTYNFIYLFVCLLFFYTRIVASSYFLLCVWNGFVTFLSLIFIYLNKMLYVGIKIVHVELVLVAGVSECLDVNMDHIKYMLWTQCDIHLTWFWLYVLFSALFLFMLFWIFFHIIFYSCNFFVLVYLFACFCFTFHIFRFSQYLNMKFYHFLLFVFVHFIFFLGRLSFSFFCWRLQYESKLVQANGNLIMSFSLTTAKFYISLYKCRCCNIWSSVTLFCCRCCCCWNHLMGEHRVLQSNVI